MSIIDGGKLELVVSRDVLLQAIDRSDGPKVALSVEDLADKIHKAFCEPRSFRGLQGEIHRRQHIEIARAIIEA